MGNSLRGGQSKQGSGDSWIAEVQEGARRFWLYICENAGDDVRLTHLTHIMNYTLYYTFFVTLFKSASIHLSTHRQAHTATHTTDTNKT